MPCGASDKRRPKYTIDGHPIMKVCTKVLVFVHSQEKVRCLSSRDLPSVLLLSLHTVGTPLKGRGSLQFIVVWLCLYCNPF
jgi:hypothetical protein